MKQRKRIILVLFLLIIFMLTGCGDDEGEDPFDFSGIEPKNINPWTYVEDTDITLNSSLKNVAASSSELAITIGIMGIVFSIFYMVIRICFSRSAATKEEIKREAVMKGMIAIMLFSIPFWLGLFKYFAELLV
ncbi:MAG: hypothetical protein PHW34_09170 [Hespellia sp.]|nr:hypothetical protein [Hespellia sp.]